MLIMFKAKNYTSFKDEVMLDFRATLYKQHPSHVLDISDNIKILKTTAIYGANASGKSNLISAMYLFKAYIFNQFFRKINDVDDDILENNRKKIDVEPFLLTDNINKQTEFEIIFYYNEKQIQYGFICEENSIINEWYYINDERIFERTVGNKIKYGKKHGKVLKQYNKIPSDKLYLALLEYWLEDNDKKDILQDFIDFFIKKYIVYFEIIFEASIKGTVGSFRFTKKIIEDEDYRNSIAKYLQKADTGISGLDVQEVSYIDKESGMEKKDFTLKTLHKVFDSKSNNVRTELFDLHQESTGTLRFLSYIQNIVNRLENGGVFIVDELSARLHPLLTKLIVDIFQSSSNKKAQLIFTTHDISLLTKEQFRRDEVIFVDKNEKGESTAYALSDIKIRQDATFNRDYLQGKYGAIPILEYDAIFDGE